MQPLMQQRILGGLQAWPHPTALLAAVGDEMSDIVMHVFSVLAGSSCTSMTLQAWHAISVARYKSVRFCSAFLRKISLIYCGLLLRDDAHPISTS